MRWEFDIVQPAGIMGENQLRQQRHWAGHRRALRPWRDAAEQNARACLGRKPFPKCEITVVMRFANRRRRDPHNYVSTVCKAVVDGLVAGGCWPDDTPEYVTVAEPRIEVVSTKAPHLFATVIVKEVTGDQASETAPA